MERPTPAVLSISKKISSPAATGKEIRPERGWLSVRIVAGTLPTPTVAVYAWPADWLIDQAKETTPGAGTPVTPLV